MDPLIEKIKKTLVDHEMVKPGDSVLVGVSGGPDSIALLHGLLELKGEMGFSLSIAHLNHDARGKESDQDAEFVKSLGKTLQISTWVEKVDVAAHQTKTKSSFQETARHLRFEFFQEVISQSNANKVALGHTSDDQAETVLMNLLRGSGPQGMGGMNPVRQPYIRPLFYCSRSEVIRFLECRKISYRNDSSNEKTDYLRNRIRLELMSYLQNKYNPRIKEQLFEASGIFRAENELIKVLEDREFGRVVSASEDGEFSVDLESFTALPLALRRRLVRKCIQGIRGDLKRIALVHIQDILSLFKQVQKGKSIDLPGKIQAVCLGDQVVFKRIRESGSGILNGKEFVDSSNWRTPLNIPGETPVEKAGLILKAEVIDPVEEKITIESGNQAFLDYEKTGGNILIRFFQAGDRMTPLGMKGTKRLKSLFIDEKVPQEIRSRIPVLTTGDNNIIWVYGTRIAHPYRVTSETTKVLFIKGLP